MEIDWEYLGKESLPPGEIFPKTVEAWRAQVPGGWLVLTVMGTSDGVAQSTTFYPDPSRERDGGTL